MKQTLLHIFLFLTAALLIFGCVPDIFVNPSSNEREEIDCTISFGSPQGANVTVSTKNELGVVRESNVFNLYLLIFDGNNNDSKKLYGHYFTGDNLGATSLSNYWTVGNMTSSSDPVTNGILHIKTSKASGCTIVAVANMNPNDLDVSSGLLSTIKTYKELKELIATQIRSEVTANSGYFMMTGQVHGVNIQGNAEDANDISHKSLSLERLYAKVSFNVRIAEGAPIRSFTPDKWQIINVPTCSYLLPNVSDAASTSDQFFSTNAQAFEIETLTANPTTDTYADGVTPVSTHSFTFYMMENRKTPSSSFSGYANREKQISGTDPYRAFIYANQYSTYVILTGKIVMNTSITHNNEIVNNKATLDATVQYKIHLGNFGSDVTDFNTLRNHNYIYNIYINGAEDIKAEVIDGTENEPGATGRVVVADEQIFTSDCHYSTQVISFHANYLTDPTQISWYVQTPFNPDGAAPDDVSDYRTELDYRWVEFRLNDQNAQGHYTNKRVDYKPHNYNKWEQEGIPEKKRTKYVDELVDYLIQQKEQYDIDVAARTINPSAEWHNDFEETADPDDPAGPKITFTAFVDEFYYTEDPLGGGWDPTLWKNYVANQPMRKLHILSSYKKSPDKESIVVGSSFTIQQRSIQSIYAIHESADLHSAWGMEFIDDSRFETGLTKYWKNKDFEDCGNTSPTNGRLNTLKLWGILDKYGNDSGITRHWSDFLNMHGTNETAQLWVKTDPDNPDGRDFHYLRYSCLSRNRDNDGDGVIDPEEIHWYMASDIQLIGVFLGSYGIEGDARLYQMTAAEQTAGGTDWRQHVVASNRYIYPSTLPSSQIPTDKDNSNKYPRVIWAEEGMNGSSLGYTGDGQTASFSTRCIRNLGYYVDGGVRKDITTAPPTIEPDHYMTVTRKHVGSDSEYTGAYDPDTYYEFDCSRINLASLRDPIDHELVGHDENSRMACLPSKFEAAPASQSISLSGKTAYSFNQKTYNLTKYEGLNTYLDACFGGLDSDFSVCPHGYRLPNVREMAVIWNLLMEMDTGDSGYLGSGSETIPSRTYWSKGKNGSKKVTNAWGWGMLNTKLLMADASNNNHSVKAPRCVRDL